MGTSVKLLMLTLLATVGMGAAIGLASSASAHDSVHVCIGGYGDGNGVAMSAAKADQGYPCDEVVQYSASVGLPGEVPAYQSIAEAAQGALDAVARHPGKQVVIEGWSLGAVGANDFGNKITDFGKKPLPPNVQLIQDDNAYASTGAMNHPLAPPVLNVVGPFMGVPPPESIPPVPNSIHRYQDDSAWGALNEPPNDILHDGVQLAMVGQNHILPDQRDPHQTFVGEDGVINEVYPNPAGPQPPPQVSFTPSFWGEAPCIAADGSHYFTPGNAPC